LSNIVEDLNFRSPLSLSYRTFHHLFVIRISKPKNYVKNDSQTSVPGPTKNNAFMN